MKNNIRFFLFILSFLISFTNSNIIIFSDELPLVLKKSNNEISIYSGENKESGKIIFNDKKLVDTFLNESGEIVLIFIDENSTFYSDFSNRTSFEDINWVSCKKYGEEIHKKRIFPKYFRSFNGPIWNFDLGKNEISKIKFDKNGRYLRASSSGGIIIIGDHINKSDLIEKWGAPVGGLYKVGFGNWFHNASDLDSRYGYEEMGNLYMKQIAIRTCEVFLQKYNKRGKKLSLREKVTQLEQSRIITFKTGSDGIPSGKLGVVTNEKLKSEKLLFSMSNNSIDIFKLNKNNNIILEKFENGKIIKNDIPIFSKDLVIIKKMDKKTNFSDSKSIKSSIDGKKIKIYLFNDKGFRISNSWFKNGGVFYYFDNSNNILYLNWHEKHLRKGIKFEDSLLDYELNSVGDIYILTQSKKVIIEENPENILSLKNEIRFIKDIKEIEETFKKRNGIIKIDFHYKTFTLLSKLSHSLIGTLPMIKNSLLEKNIIYKIKNKEVKCSRIAEFSKEKQKWEWINPTQIYDKDSQKKIEYKLLLNKKKLIPPTNLGEGYVIDIIHNKGFSENNKLFFAMENFPQFNKNGLNDRSILYDENNNGISGGFMNNIIENSIVYKWQLEKKDNSGKWKVLPHMTKYKVSKDYNYNSECLNDRKFKNISKFDFKKNSYPFFYTINEKLINGEYKINLEVFFDFYDFNSPKIDRNDLEKIKKAHFSLNSNSSVINLSGSYKFEIK